MELCIGIVLCLMYPVVFIAIINDVLYSPRDGVVDPAGFCTALTRAATRSGAKVIENCSITGIETETSLFGSRQISAVNTDKGSIKTNCVINCTGD